LNHWHRHHAALPRVPKICSRSSRDAWFAGTTVIAGSVVGCPTDALRPEP
jgi:hypothetical protein